MPLQFDSGREQFGISTRPPAIAGCTSLFPTAGPWRQHNKLGNLHSLPRPLSLFVFQPPSVASGSFSCFSRLTACVLLSCLFCSALVLLLLPRFSSLVLCPPFACHLPEVLSACFPRCLFLRIWHAPSFLWSLGPWALHHTLSGLSWCLRMVWEFAPVFQRLYFAGTISIHVNMTNQNPQPTINHLKAQLFLTLKSNNYKRSYLNCQRGNCFSTFAIYCILFHKIWVCLEISWVPIGQFW